MSLDNTFKIKAFARLVKSDIWESHLKPELISIKDEIMRAESEAETEFEAIKRDVRRTNTIRVINRIITTVEKSANKANILINNK